MALNADQIAYFERRLGTPLDSDDLEPRLARLGTPARVAVEALEIRLATMLNSPLSFNVQGDYSEDRSNNVDHLRSMLAQARADVEAETPPVLDPRLMRGVPARSRWGR